MILAIWTAATALTIATIAHLFSIAIAIMRCRKRGAAEAFLPPPTDAPPVSIIRPVCGIENYIEETLRSSFHLAYPHYELLFCVASPRDPVIPLVEELIVAFPHVSASLLIGGEQISANPKLNNCVKGWHAARNELIVMADSNVLMPRDYIQRLLLALQDDTGLVCSPPIGTRPRGFWAEVECAFLNAFQARWQYVADTLGLGFAQGKTMLWRRSVLEDAGGIGVLASELAEDAASTKIVRGAGLNVRLVDGPFEQPLGLRRMADVWNRQVRWARLRRASFPLFFALECLGGVLPPVIALGFLCVQVDFPMLPVIAGFLSVWYGAELALVAAAAWPAAPLFIIHALLRDALMPAIWIAGWWGTDFVWRGNAMSVATTAR
jgi:ceramide glucosyltransferase